MKTINLAVLLILISVLSFGCGKKEEPTKIASVAPNQMMEIEKKKSL